HTSHLYAHSRGVSIYGLLTARQLGLNSHVAKLTTAMAGLFHGAGEQEIDQATLDKPRIQLTPSEVRVLETHPDRGANLLRQVPGMTEDLLQIVLQHHETCCGTGYPRRLRKDRIQPFAKLLGLVD